MFFVMDGRTDVRRDSGAPCVKIMTTYRAGAWWVNTSRALFESIFVMESRSDVNTGNRTFTTYLPVFQDPLLKNEITVRQQEDIFVRELFCFFSFRNVEMSNEDNYRNYMTTHARKAWCVNAVNDIVLLSKHCGSRSCDHGSRKMLAKKVTGKERSLKVFA